MKNKTRGYLDDALIFLYDRITQYYDHDKLKKECFFDNPKIDVEAIIHKLKADNLIHYGLKETNKNDFKISVDGCVIKERGGYGSKWRREWFSRHTLIEKLVIAIISSALSLLIGWLLIRSKYQSDNQQESRQDPALKMINETLPNFQKHIMDSARHVK